ncbi:ABC transporter permease [Saccharicrinis sp. FJH62]|uniref:ABC transporter permease n=1 Tax=Saccharicrinis sp. FJH62 TaxID=3344657 RepID=UPI0035D4B4E1
MYSLIKIGGFAFGIAACLLISLYIIDELSYDKQIPDASRVYRIVASWHKGGDRKVCLPAPFANALKQDFPEVEAAGRINRQVLLGAGSNEIRRTDRNQNSYEEGFAYADQGLLEVFDVPMVYGELEHALAEPNSIMISKQKAEKYFPNENPVGKTMIINNEVSKPYRIGGVMDFPEKSHFQYDFLISLKGVEFWDGEQTEWNANNYHTYIKLSPGTDAAQFEKKLSAITKNYFIPRELEAGNKNANELLERYSYYLQPVRDIHLKSQGIDDDLVHGDIRFVWIFGIIAAFILAIASINFINLSTAKVANRAKEVGLRKTIGSSRQNLIQQFITESFFVSFLSFILGILLAFVFLPWFNVLSDKSLSIPWNSWWLILPSLLLASVIVGFITGLYPSFYLSSFRPVDVLKGNLSTGSKNSRLRNALVTFQYIVSIILISGTFVIGQQVKFMLNKKVGFNKEQVLLLHETQTISENITTLKNELLKLPEVKNVSVGDYLPIAGAKRNGSGFVNEGKSWKKGFSAAQNWTVDKDYIKTMGMHISVGNDFSGEMSTGSNNAIINQTMAKQLQLDDPVGKRITNGGKIWTVIGVVEDFHFESLKEKIGGMCLSLGSSPDIVSIKVGANNIPGAIKSITKVWDEFCPNQPIRYTFLDDDFNRTYSSVQRTGHIFSTFALLAIIVASLGLFALSSFLIEQRKKEVGIRKVSGARVAEILAMLNRDFIKWVLIAFVIATPIAYYAMNKWLENFAYRTNLSWWIFALPGLLALGIALLTVSFQSWKAATKNPVDSLRYE